MQSLFTGCRIKGVQEAENAVSQFQGASHQYLLVAGCHREILLHCHVVDVLDGNEFLFHIVQVINQGAVTCRPAEDGSVVAEEGFVIRRDCYGIGILGLVCEADIILHPVAFLIFFLHFRQSSFEQRPMLRRNGNREVDTSIGITHIFLSLDKMLCKSGAHLISIAMEFQNTLGFAAIAETGLFQKSGCGVCAIRIGRR